MSTLDRPEGLIEYEVWFLTLNSSHWIPHISFLRYNYYENHEKHRIAVSLLGDIHPNMIRIYIYQRLTEYKVLWNLLNSLFRNSYYENSENVGSHHGRYTPKHISDNL